MKTKVQSIKWDDSGKIMTGSFEKIGKAVSVNILRFDAKIREQAERHGWKQRFGDLESGDKTGQAKFEAWNKLKAHLESGGDWEMQAERDTVTEVCEALHRVMPKYSMEQLQEAAKVDPEQVAEWRSDPRVKLELAKARAKKAAEAAKLAPKEELVIRGLK